MLHRFFSNYDQALDFLSDLRRDGHHANLRPTHEDDTEARGATYVVSWWPSLQGVC